MNHILGHRCGHNGLMQRPLAFITLGAIVAVGALCAAAAAAYGVEPRDGAVATSQSAALVVPSGYKPSTFAPSPVRAAAAGLVSVAPGRAVAVTGVTSISPAGRESTPGPLTDSKTKPTPGTRPDSTKPTPPAKPGKPAPPAPETTTKPAPPAPAAPTPPTKGSDKGSDKGSNKGNDVNNKGTGSGKGSGDSGNGDD
jgi:hypothetical protein